MRNVDSEITFSMRGAGAALTAVELAPKHLTT
jgi:hypothetical protein